MEARDVSVISAILFVSAHVATGASLYKVLTVQHDQQSQMTSKDSNHNLPHEGQTRHKRETFDAVGFLLTYGYLDQPYLSGKVFQSEDTIRQGIRDFQAFNSLHVTGQLDEATIGKMDAPRCGFPDILSGMKPNLTSARTQLSQPQHFTTLDTRWMKNTLTWRPVTVSKTLPQHTQLKALERALQYWSDVTPLKFHRTSGEADIHIEFARGDHGDNNRFNGQGGVLAHAFQPGPGLGGDVHLDDDERWTVGGGGTGTDLTIVAAHELGHALGLGHSQVGGALMAPYYSYSPALALHQDDIRGMQALYGTRRPETTPTTTTATSSTIATATTTPVAATTSQKPVLPWYCGPDFRVDAAARAGDESGSSYLFRGNQVFRVGPLGLSSGYPRNITQVFPQGPDRSLDSAFYLPDTRAHYLFQGQKLWRYTGMRLDPGYPKTLLAPDDVTRFRSSAILTVKIDHSVRVFMFDVRRFWEWDPRRERLVSGGYPLTAATYWHGLPSHPDAAVSDDHSCDYFFKGDKYFTLRNRVLSGEARMIAKDWFGKVCD